jgi:hypothetical protein
MAQFMAQFMAWRAAQKIVFDPASKQKPGD